eukprot:s4424_g6.t1
MYYLSDGHAAANLIKLKVSQEMFIKAATDSAEDDYVTMHTVSKDNSWIPYWMAVETGEKLIKWLLRHCVEAVACSCVLAIADDCTVIDLKEKCAKAAADRPIRKHLADLKESLKKAEDNVSKRARGSD